MLPVFKRQQGFSSIAYAATAYNPSSLAAFLLATINLQLLFHERCCVARHAPEGFVTHVEARSPPSWTSVCLTLKGWQNGLIYSYPAGL